MGCQQCRSLLLSHGPPDANSPFTGSDSFRLTALSGETTARVAQLVMGFSW
jgi:hypothetical protein